MNADVFTPDCTICFNCGQALTTATKPSIQSQLQKLIPKELFNKLQAARTDRSMEGERRIITMLFCDIQGSTAMAETLDPEEWAEIMNGAFEYLIPPVFRYEGTVARLMGDAILAFFGAPIAHEDDPQRAVRAGLEIIAGIQRYRANVQRERHLDFDVQPLGEIEVKGKSEPIEVYQVTGLKTAPGRPASRQGSPRLSRD